MTVSPLMAQEAANAPSRIITPYTDKGNGGSRALADTSLVSTAILSSLPPRSAAMAFPNRPASRQDSDQAKEPGRRSPLLGILLVAGGIAAAVLLLTGGDGDRPAPAPITPTAAPVVSPTGTILSAGPPVVSPPSTQ